MHASKKDRKDMANNSQLYLVVSYNVTEKILVVSQFSNGNEFLIFPS